MNKKILNVSVQGVTQTSDLVAALRSVIESLEHSETSGEGKAGWTDGHYHFQIVEHVPMSPTEKKLA